MFDHYQAKLRWMVAGGVALAAALFAAAPEGANAAQPPSEGWSFHAPGTPGAAPAPTPARPAVPVRPGEKAKDSFSFHSPVADFDPSAAPGRLSAGGTTGGFAAPKDVVALASKTSCGQTGGG